MSESTKGGESSERAPASLAEAVVKALAESESPPASVGEAKSDPKATAASADGAPRIDGAPPAPALDVAEGTSPGASKEGASKEGAPKEGASPPEESAPPGASDHERSPRSDEETAPRIAVAREASDGISVRYFGRTDVGLVREHNEDNFLVVDVSSGRRGVDDEPIELKLDAKGCLLAVCDGMGGAAAGEVASQMAVDTLYEMVTAAGPSKDRDHFARRLVRAIEEAGSRIFGAAKLDRTRRGMGTTSTVAGLVDQILFVGQVGDSRAYVLRGDQFAQITKDQSLVNQLIEAGQLTEEEAEAFEHSNIILQALGTTEEVVVDLTFLELRRGDRLLLCSDGLSGLVHVDMMKDVLRAARDLPEAAEQLISMANAGGGHDNITVVLAEFDGLGLKESDRAARVAYQQYPLPPATDAPEPSAPRAPSIKPSTPKPGADVKHASASALAGESGAARWWVVALLVVIVVALLIAIISSIGDPGEATIVPATRVTLSTSHPGASQGSTPREPPAAEEEQERAVEPSDEPRAAVAAEAPTQARTEADVPTGVEPPPVVEEQAPAPLPPIAAPRPRPPLEQAIEPHPAPPSEPPSERLAAPPPAPAPADDTEASPAPRARSNRGARPQDEEGGFVRRPGDLPHEPSTP